MGDVFRAQDTRLDRTVVIKILPAGDGADRRERFEREGRAIARLNHPHICVLHDAGYERGVYCPVMEFVEGETAIRRSKTGEVGLLTARHDTFL